MGGAISQLAIYALAGGVVGIVAGLLLGVTIGKHRIHELSASNRRHVDNLSAQKAEIAAKLAKYRSTIRSLQAAAAQSRSELKSAVKKSKLLAKNVLMLRDERESTKVKVSVLQKSLDAVKQQTLALQQEFDKVGAFYKGELVKSFEKRKALESELEEARSEQEAFARRVEQSILEHGSPEEMITAAQLRLGQLEVLERNVNKLETENAQLRNDAKKMKREKKALEQDVAELDELRINNKQLVRCLESLENSRQQYEQEAEKHRDQADQSEQLSETLRLKLDDLEKNFAAIEQQQMQAIKQVRRTAVESTSSNPRSSTRDAANDQEVVDLAEYSKRR